MVFLTEILSIAGLHLAIAISPGPNTIAICCMASTRSRLDGLSVAAGVVAGTGLWIGIAMMGVGAVIAQNDRLFSVLRGFAAAYLVWIGLRMLIATPVGPAAASRGPPFFVGLLTALANPLAIAFWLGTFLAAIPPDAPRHVYAEIFAIVIFQSILWYSFLAILFSSVMRGRDFPAARLFRYAAAGAMILIGLNAVHAV